MRIAALVAYLRTTLRLPVRQVQAYLATMHQLHLSVGEMVELTHDVRRQLQPQADSFLAQAQQQPVVHQDETGWREDRRQRLCLDHVDAGPGGGALLRVWRQPQSSWWRCACWGRTSGACWSATSMPPTI